MSRNNTSPRSPSFQPYITVIPIDKSTMITTSPSREVLQRREETLCKFIREYIDKVAQVVVAARRVSNHHHNDFFPNKKHNESLSESWNDLHAPYSQWFRIEMTDSHRVQKYVEEECIGNWDPRHSNFELTIDISLSAEPLSEHVLLERWKIKFKKHQFASNKNHELSPSLLYKQMTIQIRSILSYLRLLPSHCIVQSWEQSMVQQSQLIKPSKSTQHTSIPDMIPFALYHLMYSQHNKQNDNISNFVGNSKSFSFEPLMCKFGKIMTTVFYGANIRKEFEWLIRSVPGKNPPYGDNLSDYARSRYWDKKDDTTTGNDIIKKQKPYKTHKDLQRVICAPDGSVTPNTRSNTKSNNSPFELLDDQMVINIVNKSSPPIKSLNNMTNFHESPLLDTSTPKLDPMKEMEKIRLSTIFGSAPPVISLADVHGSVASSNHRMSNNNPLAGSQLIDNIVREKQIMSRKQSKQLTIMETLGHMPQDDTVELSNGSLISADTDDHEEDMNCEESDHDDIQDEIFQGYQHQVDAYDETNVNQKHIAQISHFINMCENASKLKLESFERKDALLDDQNDGQELDGDSKKYFDLLSKQFQIRQQRLIQLKKSSTAILSENHMNQK
eukprot:84410_1